MEKSDGKLATGDQVGQWGLQAAFDERLTGTASRSVVIRDAKDGVVERTLRRWSGQRPKNLKTTLDLDVQRAAERALGDEDQGGTGGAAAVDRDVLAVANRPSDSTLDRALTGPYPPGSTFKVISTAALLRAGLSTGETVACPAT